MILTSFCYMFMITYIGIERAIANLDLPTQVVGDSKKTTSFYRNWRASPKTGSSPLRRAQPNKVNKFRYVHNYAT